MVNKDKKREGIIIKKTLKKGLGLFARKNFIKGEIVYSFKKGRTIRQPQIKNLTEDEKKHINRLSKGRYEIIELPACRVNHSCDPNIVEIERVAYAIKPIEKGEEITIDYRPISYIEIPFHCHCISKNCAKLIMGNYNLCYCGSELEYKDCHGK